MAIAVSKLAVSSKFETTISRGRVTGTGQLGTPQRRNITGPRRHSRVTAVQAAARAAVLKLCDLDEDLGLITLSLRLIYCDS
jgi:hypothetical protein